MPPIPAGIVATVHQIRERIAHLAALPAQELGGLMNALESRVADELRHSAREATMLAADLPASPIVPVGYEPPLPPVVDRVLIRARDEWRSGVAEPPRMGAARIDEYIRDPDGLGWSSADAKHLDRPVAYTRNGQFAWCGAFAAYAWQAGGLRARIRRDAMPSCYKLHRWASGSPRIIAPAAVQPGDVVVVGPGNGHPWGAHITIARGPVEAGQVPTYEGNAVGEGPDGAQQEGVIRRKRPLSAQDPRTYRVLYAVRFMAEDLEG